MTTTIIHISDTHFGQSGIGTNHADDLDMLRRVIDYARESRADAIVHTGDFFDQHDPPQTVIDDVCEVLSPKHRYVPGFNDYYIPFYYIRGDYGHDMNGVTTATTGLNDLTTLPLVEMLYPPTGRTVGANNEVALLGIPAHMNPHFTSGAESIPELSFELHKNCEFVILCVHLTLSNINTGGYMDWKKQYTAHNVLNAIEIHGNPSTNSTGVDLLACGDLHNFRKERLSFPPSIRNTKVVYAGSLTGRYKGPNQDGYAAKYQINGNRCEIKKIVPS